MSREQSYFENNGIPLQAAHNAGRVRHAYADATWFSTFGVHPAQTAEQMQMRMHAAAMPEPGRDIASMEAEGDARREHSMAAVTRNEPLAVPNLLQRAAAAGSSGANSTDTAAAVSQPGVNQPTQQGGPATDAGGPPN